jgi:excisionase family DNA binding protein
MTIEKIVAPTAIVTPPTPAKLAVSISEAADRLGLCRASIYKLIRAGRLRPVKVGARTLIPISQLTALLGDD